ncbi:IS110 family transposase [Microbacterium sp.]|uniref:IS110 family transposase n=1 Tax=Microbacterium sp. TaxID=51671 RepID=UPI0027347040|nr:IS110 family transposase [Microbacterium sp.]MDP3950070.1 IS110 family transposase [Microbacterium sp.]
MAVEDSTGTVDWCLEPERQTSNFSRPPHGGRHLEGPLVGKGAVGWKCCTSRCAGLEVSKKDAKVCLRVAGAGRGKAAEAVTTWSSATSRISALREHLTDEQITCVVMEATGDSWKPFYYLLEDLPGVEVVLVNARHVKNLPRRKTDVADATWLAQLGAHGLVRGSFEPPEPIRQLRDLTRTRTSITRKHAREIQRLEKLLEDAGVKLSSVATDIVGVSGRAMIEALIAGDLDAAGMVVLARRRMTIKIPQLTEAPVGRFNEHHAFLARVHLDLIDQHTAVTEHHRTDRGDDRVLCGFHHLICTIPGISTRTADVVVSETGGEMSRLPTAKHLASWAGTTPGNNESAGKVKSSRTRPGNPYLQCALGASAMSIARTPGTAEGQRRHRASTSSGVRIRGSRRVHRVNGTPVPDGCVRVGSAVRGAPGSRRCRRGPPGRRRSRTR